MILIRHGESEFNVHFSKTRRDPGIRDPALTELGRRQIEAAADIVAARFADRARRIVTSPYTRTLQSAAILADILGLPVEIDAAVGEHAFFTCDIGTPRRDLRETWPHLDFDHLDEEWWPVREEEPDVDRRALAYRARMAADDAWPETLVVTHWGFIRSLTGERVPNAAILRLDPTLPRPEGVEVVSVPDV
jgi:broad specificity phosphatase PhoE